jgi:AAA15 family ATPase/GTPase
MAENQENKKENKEHFIKEIEIKDFKCFKEFKADGFKRVNLIGGKNNVGKTAFMEACYINAHSNDINSIYTAIINIKFKRNTLEILQSNVTLDLAKKLFENSIYYNTKSNINKVIFKTLNNNGIKEYEFNINNKKTKININDFSYILSHIKNIKFLDRFGYDNKDLSKIFIETQIKEKEEELYSYLNKFDSNIEKFKIFDNSPECKIKDRNKYQELNEFGDGLKHYISIICSLYACEDGYLFIDEIDNGIHNTQLDELWNIILTISEEQNVQVFATTHSKECIESFERVSEERKEQDVTYTKLTKLDDGSIFAGVRDFELLQSSLSQHHEVR